MVTVFDYIQQFRICMRYVVALTPMAVVPPKGTMISYSDIRAVAEELGIMLAGDDSIDILKDGTAISFREFAWGVETEREHLHPDYGGVDASTNVWPSAWRPPLLLPATIAAAHFREDTMYYTHLEEAMQYKDSEEMQQFDATDGAEVEREHFADKFSIAAMVGEESFDQRNMIALAHINKYGPNYYRALHAAEKAHEAKM